MEATEYKTMEIKKIPEDYRKRIENTLSAVPTDRRMCFYCLAEDANVLATKKTLLSTALRCIPAYFLSSMYDVRLSEDGKKVYPVFRRVQQAAWDAATAEYIKEKSEWIQKFGTE